MASINHAQALMEAGRFDESRNQFEHALDLDAEHRRWTSNIRQGLKRLDRVEQVALQISAVAEGKLTQDSMRNAWNLPMSARRSETIARH